MQLTWLSRLRKMTAGESWHFDWLHSNPRSLSSAHSGSSSARLHEPHREGQVIRWCFVTVLAFAFTLQRPSRCHLQLLLIQAIQAKTVNNIRNSLTIRAFCSELFVISQSSSSFWVLNPPLNRFLAWPLEERDLLLNWPMIWPAV